MLCSEDGKEREFAVSKILAIRGDQELGDKSVRLRQLPYLNLEATKLEDHMLLPRLCSGRSVATASSAAG